MPETERHYKTRGTKWGERQKTIRKEEVKEEFRATLPVACFAMAKLIFFSFNF